MRVAVLFDSVGPYHIARLNATARVCDVVCVELAPSSNEYAWKRDDSSIRFDHVSLFPNRPSETPSIRQLQQLISAVFQRSTPQVVAVPGWSSRLAVAAMLWAKRHHIPLILMSESSEGDGLRVFWKEWIKAWYLRRFRSALVGGRRHFDYLTKLGMSPDKICLGYDAIDNGYFGNRSTAIGNDPDTIRKQYSLPKKYFLASARFIEKKNLVRLLDAYAQYRQLITCEPWGLVLLGDGHLRPEIENKCRRLSISEHVVMPGFKQYQQLPAYYHLAECFIHASTIEQWGLVVNEAMASGLPVIVSQRCGCVPELVHEGQNGLIFDPFNQSQLTSHMMKLTVMPESDRLQMGESSREIISNWGPERFAAGMRLASEAAI